MTNFRNSAFDEWLQSFDPYHHALTTTDVIHRAIHEGFVFSARYAFSGLANGANADILLNVPADVYPHLRPALVSVTDTPVTFTLYEGTTTSAAGTAVSAFNRNRNNAAAASLVVTHTPTVTNAGTAIDVDTLTDVGGFFTTGPSQGASFQEEWNLAPSTKYLLRLNNGTGGTIAGAISLLWYELNFDPA